MEDTAPNCNDLEAVANEETSDSNDEDDCNEEEKVLFSYRRTFYAQSKINHLYQKLDTINQPVQCGHVRKPKTAQ